MISPHFSFVGDSFLSLSSDIEAAYKEYLANYNNVTLVENSYKQKEALWNEIIKVIKASAYVFFFFYCRLLFHQDCKY